MQTKFSHSSRRARAYKTESYSVGRGVEQRLAYLVHSQGVAGSTPASATIPTGISFVLGCSLQQRMAERAPDTGAI